MSMIEELTRPRVRTKQTAPCDLCGATRVATVALIAHEYDPDDPTKPAGGKGRHAERLHLCAEHAPVVAGAMFDRMRELADE